MKRVLRWLLTGGALLLLIAIGSMGYVYLASSRLLAKTYTINNVPPVSVRSGVASRQRGLEVFTFDCLGPGQFRPCGTGRAAVDGELREYLAGWHRHDEQGPSSARPNPGPDIDLPSIQRPPDAAPDVANQAGGTPRDRRRDGDTSDGASSLSGTRASTHRLSGDTPFNSTIGVRKTRSRLVPSTPIWLTKFSCPSSECGPHSRRAATLRFAGGQPT